LWNVSPYEAKLRLEKLLLIDDFNKREKKKQRRFENGGGLGSGKFMNALSNGLSMGK
jgi:hypothetical protein